MKRILACTLLAAACTHPASPRSPANPASDQFAAWLAAFNSSDRATLVAYHEHQFPYEVASDDVKNIDRELGLSRGTGGFELKKIEGAANQMTAILKERHSDQFARAVMEVDPAAPHRVVRFEIHPIPTPAELLTPEDRKARTVDATRRRAVIDGIAKELEEHYLDLDVAKQMIASMRDHLARGDYDKATDGDELAMALTKDLRDVSHDLHLDIMFGPRPQGPEPKPEERRAMVRRMNYGFGTIERMPGNVAHLVILRFPPIDGDEALDGVGKLMSEVADADALILDLRDNGGGDSDTVALIASYLLDERTHLNDFYTRDTGKTEESWTRTDVRGKRFGGKKPVYVLTSKRTFSGGEELAYDLQALHRAKTVGETTCGGAHTVASHPIGDRFAIRVPSGRPINAVTKKDWEGVGVMPDVAVSADAALEEAHRLATQP